MAKFIFNSDNLNGENSLIIEGIKIDTTLIENTNIDIPLSLISSQGDLNGDGNQDLFVQSSLSLIDNDFVQENFVVLGSNSLPSNLNLVELDGSNGFSLSNIVAFSHGFSDINGDNLDELLITRLNPVDQTFSSTILFGSNQFSTPVDLANFDGSNGFNIVDNSSDSLINLALTGDVNNDSINDLVFLASNSTEDSVENVHKIVFGRENYPADLDIASLDGSNGFNVNGEVLLSGIGIDISGDNIDDLIFNSLQDPTLYVVFGNNEFTEDINLASLNSSQGFAITEQGSNPNDRFFGGLSEDINGDGIGDIVIQKNLATESAENPLEADRVFVIYGSNDSSITNIDLANLDTSNGFTFDSKTQLQSIVDINGDNLEDLFIKNLNDNKTYVLFGSNNIAANVDLNSLDGTNGFIIENTNIDPQAIANFGIIGDINGDSLNDVAIDGEGDKTYILLGSQEAFPPSLDLTNNNTNAIEISGSKTTNGIADFADLNGDGADEIIFNSIINEENNSLASSSILLGDRDLSFATSNSGENPSENETIELFRFRNTSFESGTYVFVGEAEKNAILADEDLSNTFALDGVQPDDSVNPAFTASTQQGDDLIPFYRLKSLDVPGTFLFVSTEEYDAIFADDSNQRDKWEQEGFDGEGNDIPEFYLLDGSADRGIEFNRFQNTQNGTFLYAGTEESQAIASDPNLSNLFNNQGVAFESLT